MFPIPIIILLQKDLTTKITLNSIKKDFHLAIKVDKLVK